MILEAEDMFMWWECVIQEEDVWKRTLQKALAGVLCVEHLTE